jgi:hypothetical protein
VYFRGGSDENNVPRLPHFLKTGSYDPSDPSNPSLCNYGFDRSSMNHSAALFPRGRFASRMFSTTRS